MLNKVENQIFALETQYVQDECPIWNIIKGFDGFNERLGVSLLFHLIELNPLLDERLSHEKTGFSRSHRMLRRQSTFP